jgi:hypothetical protein
MITILGIKLSYETLVFLGLFLGSELIGASKLRDNSVVQLILSGINALKPLRREDDQIDKIKKIFED